MENQEAGNDRAYFAQRAAEEFERAESATDSDAAEAHRKLQLIYLEKASVGAREASVTDEIG